MIDKEQIKALLPAAWDELVEAAWRAYMPILQQHGDDRAEFGLAFALLCVSFARWQQSRSCPLPEFVEEQRALYLEMLADFRLDEIEVAA